MLWLVYWKKHDILLKNIASLINLSPVSDKHIVKYMHVTDPVCTMVQYLGVVFDALISSTAERGQKSRVKRDDLFLFLNIITHMLHK
jgi:hypothetical protein